MKNPNHDEELSKRSRILWIIAIAVLIALPALVAFYTLVKDAKRSTNSYINNEVVN